MVRNTHHDDDDDDVDDDDGREPCRGQNENSKKGQHLAFSKSMPRVGVSWRQVT